MANSQDNEGGSGRGACTPGPNGTSCGCCNDDIRAALLTAAKASRLEPTRPTREPERPIVVGGETVDMANAPTETLLRAARAVREQFKEVVTRQRAHLAKLYADSTATDGFKINVKEGSREA